MRARLRFLSSQPLSPSAPIMFASLLLAFIAGFLTFGFLELSLFACLFWRPGRRSPPFISPSVPIAKDDRKESLHLLFQGDLWIAAISPSDSGKDMSNYSGQREKVFKEPRKKKDATKDTQQTCPVRRHARLEDRSLFLTTDVGEAGEIIDLRGCDIRAVSGGPEISRKWAKKYPIQLQCKNREIFGGSSTLLIYLATGWEKEAWCRVLRAASKLGGDAEDRYMDLRNAFVDYSLRLSEVYTRSPPLLSSNKNVSQMDEKGKHNKAEVGNLSKKQQLWKKLRKKISSKGNLSDLKSGSGDGESKSSSIKAHTQAEDSEGSQEAAANTDIPTTSVIPLDSGLFGEVHTTELRSDINSENSGEACNRESTATGDGKVYPSDQLFFSDMKRCFVDQGTMCWNMMFSRLFFDVYHSNDLKAAFQRFIQKQLSKVKIPSYIRGISCTDLNLGTIPPFIHNMHVLPMNPDGEWAFEADVDYSGGMLLTIETRLDVRDSLLQEKVVNQSCEGSLAGAATADLLMKGIESVVDNVSTDMDMVAQVKNGSASSENCNKGSGNTNISKSNCKSWMQSSKAGWRAMLSHVAEQVSQVPLTLGVRVLSMKGTMRLRIKSPPTDRLWFGFVLTPEINLHSEPSIGEHKISTGPVADFITSRIKMLVCDALVLPNSEDIFIPWMVSEKDDWLPEAAVPMPWNLSDMNDSIATENTQGGIWTRHNEKTSQSEQSNSKPLEGQEIPPASETVREIPALSSFPTSLLPTVPVSAQSDRRDANPEVMKSVLGMADSSQETEIIEASLKQQDLPSSDSDTNSRPFKPDSADDERRKLRSRHVKVISLGKKVGEKLDEKRRHILEKMQKGLEKNESSSIDS